VAPGSEQEDAAIDEWLKELSPSDGLRKWYGHRPERWGEFRERFILELATPEKQALLQRLARDAASSNVTLVYDARDTECNNARVLEELISRLMGGE
jgi:uncharacterized protein YeaO (DUF488 family)